MFLCNLCMSQFPTNSPREKEKANKLEMDRISVRKRPTLLAEQWIAYIIIDVLHS